MPDSDPPTNDPSSPSAGADGPTLDHAQPYRSPAAVSETSGKAGVLKSPVMWLLVLLGTTAAVAVGASVFLFRSVADFGGDRGPVRSLQQEVEDFGIYRAPPPDDDFEDVNVVVEGAAPADTSGPAPGESGETLLP